MSIFARGDLVNCSADERMLKDDFNITSDLSISTLRHDGGRVTAVEPDHLMVEYDIPGAGLCTFLLPKGECYVVKDSAAINPPKLKEIVTHEILKGFLLDDDREFVENVIGRALVSLFKRQEADEQSGEQTYHANARGFTSFDAEAGSITAKYYIKHGHLGCKHHGNKETWRADKWLKLAKNGMPRLCKYSRQLNEIANENLEKK